MHPNKILPQNRIFWDFWQILNWQNSFLATTFFGELFTIIKYTFLKPEWKEFFDAPFDMFEENKFSSLTRSHENTFQNLKPERSKMEETFQYFEKTFIYKQVLDFHFICFNEI